jgi:hypothetical protein
MIRLPAFILVGCLVCAGLILIEFGSITSYRPPPGPRLPAMETEPAAPEMRKPAEPPVNPTQHPPKTASSANDSASALRDVRLTGVVIGPDLRIAIFAMSGTNARVLSQGEVLKGWRLDSISPKGVVLSGPAGNIMLEPQADAKLVRPPPPVVVQPDQPGAVVATAPPQPVVVTPIAVGTLSAAAPGPVQTQGYPYYSPEYYGGYDAYYPWDWGWANPWVWGWPVGVVGGCWNCWVGGRFLRPGVRAFGFGYPGFFHPGFARFGFAHASFGGGFRGGARR